MQQNHVGFIKLQNEMYKNGLNPRLRITLTENVNIKKQY